MIFRSFPKFIFRPRTGRAHLSTRTGAADCTEHSRSVAGPGINWRLLHSLDLDRVVREGDIDTIQAEGFTHKQPAGPNSSRVEDAEADCSKSLCLVEGKWHERNGCNPISLLVL